MTRSISTPSKIAIAIAVFVLLLAATKSIADGIWNPGVTGGITGGVVGGVGDGVNNSSAMNLAPPATPCSGTGLLFNVACNSQYIGVL